MSIIIVITSLLFYLIGIVIYYSIPIINNKNYRGNLLLDVLTK